MLFDMDDEIKNDLVRGIKMSKVAATEHYVDNPEKIILTICELAVKKSNDWISRDDIQTNLEQELKEQITEYKRYSNKWYPIDWFSRYYTCIANNKKINLKKETISRWAFIFDRTKLNKKWAYRIKYEYYDKVKAMLEKIKNDL